MKTRFFTFLMLSAVLLGCQKDNTTNPGGLPYDIGSRGQIIGYVLRETLDSSEIAAMISSTIGSFSSFAIPKFGVSTYTVSYKSLTVAGDTVKATGLVVIPNAPNNRLPLLSYQHGTILKYSDVASMNGTLEYTLNVAFASAEGYVACAPDFLGLGGGDGEHKYLQPDEEANAVVDLLRAARKLVELTGHTHLNGQLFLTGYSQGGHATMAAQRDIETKYSAEFDLKASAPLAGPYCLSKTKQFDVMVDSVFYPSPFYLPYVAKSLMESFPGVFSGYSDIFKPPYDSLVPALVNENHGYEVDAYFPNVPSLMLRDDLKAAIKADLNHPVRIALATYDLDQGWTPKVPTHLFHCRGDDQVFYENAECAYGTFKGRGAPIEINDLGSGNHGTCAPPAFFNAIIFFAGYKTIDPL